MTEMTDAIANREDVYRASSLTTRWSLAKVPNMETDNSTISRLLSRGSVLVQDQAILSRSRGHPTGKGLCQGIARRLRSVHNWISMPGELCTVPGALRLGTRNRKTGTDVPDAGLFTSLAHRSGEAWGSLGQFRLAVVLPGNRTVTPRPPVETRKGRAQLSGSTCWAVNVALPLLLSLSLFAARLCLMPSSSL